MWIEIVVGSEEREIVWVEDVRDVIKRCRDVDRDWV